MFVHCHGDALGGELLLATVVVVLMEEMRLTLFLPIPWLTYCISVLWITG